MLNTLSSLTYCWTIQKHLWTYQGSLKIVLFFWLPIIKKKLSEKSTGFKLFDQKFEYEDGITKPIDVGLEAFKGFLAAPMPQKLKSPERKSLTIGDGR